MTTSTPLVSVEDYLKSTEKPNREYLDGVVRPKAMPTYKHAKVQSRVLRLIDGIEGFDAAPELTVKLRHRKYLVPDVAVQRRDDLQQPYPERPVYLCVEILSPEDRFGEAVAKCEDYHAWGVPYCWLIDPEKKQCWEYAASDRPNQVKEGNQLTAGEIAIYPEDLFEDL